MEIIVINERKNKTLNFVLNWSILSLMLIVIVAIFTLFIYGVINFARGRGDYKRVQQLTRENKFVQKEIEYMENEIKSLSVIIDSLSRSDTVLQDFSTLPTLKTVIAGQEKEITEDNFLDNKNLSQLSASLDELLLRAENQYATNNFILSYLKQNENLRNSIPSIPPVNGWFMRGFGYCLDPFTGTIKMHEGIDIAAPVGTPIIAPADGVVKKIQNTTDFGTIIEINHNQNFTTIYAHCQNPRINPGQSVKRGDFIADVGTSGKITGPHLHYEIRISGVPIDPLNYIILGSTSNN
ncbi:MAG: M23 family metallopeptidase [bacterium]